MKNNLFLLAAMAVLTLSSCYVGVEGGRHRHATRVVIVADNNPKDSLQSSATHETSQVDSLSSPANPKVIK